MVYSYSVLPSTYLFICFLHAIVDPCFTLIFISPTCPIVDIFANFTSLPLPFVSSVPSALSTLSNSIPNPLPPFPQTLREPTLNLASSHLICSVALTGVLALQAGRWWAEQADIDDDDDEESMEGEENEEAKSRTREPSPTIEAKKD